MAELSAREAAYQMLRQRIITMDLKPGDPLNDRELALQMGISRTPMREALIMLNIAHMVVIKPQSGTHVAPIDLNLMEQEQFARFTLEKEMLERLRGRLNHAQEADYRRNIEEYRLLEQQPESPERNTRMLAGSTARALSCAAWRRILTICCPPSSTLNGCASSVSIRTKTNRSAAPTPVSWRPCCMALLPSSAMPSASISAATSNRWRKPSASIRTILSTADLIRVSPLSAQPQ